jgi:hypothetical protein
MTQPSLLELPAVRQKVHKRVRDTSKSVYAVGRERFTGRKGNVLRLLSSYWNRWQQSPTSAELTAWSCANSNLSHLLYTRRGLSDLLLTGIIETVPHGKRICRISGRLCETWRIREVGSEESK